MVFRMFKKLLPVSCAALLGAALLAGCGEKASPETTGQLLEQAQAACAGLESFSTAYQLQLLLTDGNGSPVETSVQTYTDCDLVSGRRVQSYLSSLTAGDDSQESAVLSYYLPDEAGDQYLRYFTYNETDWYLQTLEPEDAAEQDFAFLSQIPEETDFVSDTIEGRAVYRLQLSGGLGELGELLELLPEEAETAQSLEAEYVLCLDAQTLLPYCCTLTCTDSTGTFAQGLGYAGGRLESFVLQIFYDGYNQVPEIQIPQAAEESAQFLGTYIDEHLPTDSQGRALLHADTTGDSPVVAIGTPDYFTLDEGFSNLCSACYSVISDAGTVTVQFTLEEANAIDRQAEICAELDESLAQYAMEEAYSDFHRAGEPMELEVAGRKVYCDWLTYCYTYQNDSSTTGQTVLYASEYNYWLELEEGLLLRCYGCAQILDPETGYISPDVLARQVLSDLTVS